MVGRSDMWTSTTWLKILCYSLLVAWFEFLELSGVEVGVEMLSPPPQNPHVPLPLFFFPIRLAVLGGCDVRWLLGGNEC